MAADAGYSGFPPARLDVAAQPGGEFLFLEFARGESQDNQHAFGIIGHQVETVQGKEQFSCDQRRALVAIDERLVANDAKSVCSGQ